MRRLLPAWLVALVALGCAAGAAHAEIAFTSGSCEDGGLRMFSPGGECAGGIFRMHDDGSGRTRLTNGEAPGYEGHPRSGDYAPNWSPDGTKLSFIRHTGTGLTERVFVMNADGSDQHPLRPDLPPGYDSEEAPAWSPNGELMAYVAYVADPMPSERKDRPLVVVNADGSDPRVLTPDGWVAQAPRFTPDGEHIIFRGFPEPVRDDFGQTQGESALYITDLDGENRERLAFGDFGLPTDALSPDGRWIAFAFHGLYTMRVGSGELTRLSDMAVVETTWSANGPTIFFVAYPVWPSPDSAVYGIDISRDEGPERITPLGKSGYGQIDWAASGGDGPTRLASDHSAPAVMLKSQLKRGPSHDARAKSSVPGASRIPFLVLDGSGIRRASASVAKRVSGGCRFAKSGGKLGARSACAKPHWFRVRTARGWRRAVDDLPDGTYEVRFRTTDVKGHTTKHPKRRIVKLH
jgi:Tol biopolymer transport system component